MMRNEYQDPRAYWAAYVARHGGPKGVSERLAIPYPTIAGICNGNRGIGRQLARRMSEADRDLDPSRLIWVAAIKAWAEPDSRTAQLPHNRARRAPVPDSKHPASRPNDDGHVGGADSSE